MPLLQIRAGNFPRLVAIGRRSVGFVRCEINEHLRGLVEQSLTRGKCSDSTGEKQV